MCLREYTLPGQALLAGGGGWQPLCLREYSYKLPGQAARGQRRGVLTAAVGRRALHGLQVRLRPWLGRAAVLAPGSGAAHGRARRLELGVQPPLLLGRRAVQGRRRQVPRLVQPAARPVRPQLLAAGLVHPARRRRQPDRAVQAGRGLGHRADLAAAARRHAQPAGPVRHQPARHLRREGEDLAPLLQRPAVGAERFDELPAQPHRGVAVARRRQLLQGHRLPRIRLQDPPLAEPR